MADQTALDAWHIADGIAGLIRDHAGFDAAFLRRHAAALRAASASARAIAYADALDLAAQWAEQAQPLADALAEVAQ